MRDLEQIQEHDDAGNTSRLMSLALGGLALACVLFAVGVMVGRESGEARPARQADPLESLDRLDRASRNESATAMTWPERLTGPASSAPAAAAGGASAAPSTAPSATPTSPAAVPGVTPPGPSLADPSARPVLLGPPSPAAANAGLGIRLRDGSIPGEAPTPNAATTPALPGAEGAYSVQVSSFRNLAHAQNFAQQLRQRGHRAFVAAPATDRNNNVWHRVRIGPFSSQREASAFRGTFEQRERLPTIIVRRDASAAAAAAQRD